MRSATLKRHGSRWHWTITRRKFTSPSKTMGKDLIRDCCILLEKGSWEMASGVFVSESWNWTDHFESAQRKGREQLLKLLFL